MNQDTSPEESRNLFDPFAFNGSTFILLIPIAIIESILLREYIMWIMG